MLLRGQRPIDLFILEPLVASYSGPKMVSYWRCRFGHALLVLVLWSVLPISLPFARGQSRGQLVLATSAGDPALISRLAALSRGVNREEARRVTFIAYTTGRELAQKWEMGQSPTIHSFLINIGIKKAGYCYQFAEELLIRLDAEQLRTFDLHWGESDAGTDTEHNVIVVTARGQPFEKGILLDNWRHAGRLLWGPVDGDPTHAWQENKDAMKSRLQRAHSFDRVKQEKKQKNKRPQSKSNR